MNTLVWTTDKPTVPGWYWWRVSFGRTPTTLFISRDHIHENDVFTAGALVMFLREVPGEWAGPVPLPEEPV